jgi:hypothetical protein
MMGKRNAYALAAMERKAGPHGGSRRPHELEEGWHEECPACDGSGIDVAKGDDGCCDFCDGTGTIYDY